MMYGLAIAGALSYFLGSIPFGLLLTKMAGHGDIRLIGSGNIGATNVLRTGNKGLALATLFLDGGKGAFAVFLTTMFVDHEWAGMAAGFACIMGHIFPIWLGFDGGKGVATTLGTFLVLNPPVGFIACVVWLAMAFSFRYSSLAALIATATLPLSSYLLYHDQYMLYMAGGVAFIIWVKHEHNLQRLIAGDEPRIGQKK